MTDEEHPCGAQFMGDTPELFPSGRPAAGRGRLRRDRPEFRLPGEEGAGPLPRRIFAEPRRRRRWKSSARVREALPPHIPLTVKMRRGMDDTPESRDKFFAIFDGAFARGVAAITVHGRTVRQRYEGRSSWDFLREVKAHAGPRGSCWAAATSSRRRIASTCSPAPAWTA